MGLISILSIILWTKFHPEKLKSITGPLIAIVIATCIASALSLPIQYVNIPESMFDSMNVPKLADAGLFASPCFWGTMIGFAPVAYADHATLELFNQWRNRRPGKVLMEWDAFHQRAKG